VFKNRCRASDSVIRYGGDEFLILLEHTSGDDALGLARELILGVEQLNMTYEYFTVKGRVTASIGIASRDTGEAIDLESLIRDADRALYCSKRDGKSTATHASAIP